MQQEGLTQTLGMSTKLDDSAATSFLGSQSESLTLWPTSRDLLQAFSVKGMLQSLTCLMSIC